MNVREETAAEELDEAFDRGEEVPHRLDTGTLHEHNKVPKRADVDRPFWIVAALDREAMRLAITRQALIETWIADRPEGRG